jgi:folate-binding protein YgfZ
LTCLQGLLTNDLKALQPGHAIWGGILTPKGMIITDAWMLQDSEATWVLVPDTVRGDIGQLFTRTLPPRLARFTDRSDDVAAHWLSAGTVPSAQGWFVPRDAAPFATIGIRERTVTVAQLAADNGWRVGAEADADLLKLALGWPTLGREIDDRTLPQEVRFDELGGVRYDKGCYTGQETVARLHFRGHANRRVCAVTWPPGTLVPTADLIHDGKNVGSVRTFAVLGTTPVALAMIRREVAVGATVCAGDTAGTVVDLPLPDILTPRS